jgi:hypothetical protein
MQVHSPSPACSSQTLVRLARGPWTRPPWLLRQAVKLLRLLYVVTEAPSATAAQRRHDVPGADIRADYLSRMLSQGDIG